MILSRTNLITKIALTTALLTLAGGCSNDDDTVYKEIAPLSVSAEVPAPVGTTSASGIFAFDLMEKTGVLTYTLTLDGLTGPAAAGHIHQGAVGVAGPVVVALMVPASSEPLTGMVTLDAAALASLKAGTLYVNIHTAMNPGGEIRGQLRGNK